MLSTMEQRALLAVGLVAGCVTAAGAGGYLAVRQMSTPATPATTQVVADTAVSPAPVSGTEADLTPSPAAVTEPMAAAPAAVEPVRPAPAAAVTPARREPQSVAAPVRPAPASTSRPAPAPASRPEPARREPAPASTPVEPPVSTARVEPSPRETTPARDATTTRDDRWPSRDSAATADSPLPSRSADLEPSVPPEPVRRLETVTIPADSVIGVQIETSLSSETARVEDTVRARVTRDVLARGNVVVPAGSRLMGSVTLVEDGGRIRERARLGVRFHTLVLADGTEVRLPTETIYRDGESPTKQSAAKIGGGAAGGAILGAILGGTRGAIIGAATGAGGGTAAAMAGGRKPAELRSGQSVTVRVSSDVDAQIER
jgi:type IV secretory pathway VirB10-like protein